MRRSKSVILSLLILCPILLFGQQYKGSVKNKKTGEGLPYVNIGIPSKGWGFLSNENGDFSFKVTTEKDTDTILFSLIGYQPFFLTLKDLKSKCEAGASIYLYEIIYELDAVTITPGEYETKILGSKNLEELECIEIPQSTDTAYKRMSLEKGMDPNAIGFEIGNRISIKKEQRTFVDKVQFKICLNASDTAIYRVNIYTKAKTLKRHVTPFGMVNEETLVNIMKEPVMIKCIGKTEVKTIDLSSQDIEVTDDFIVALECIYASNKIMKIGMDPALFGDTDLFIRASLMAQWLKVPLIDMTFVSATVSSKKIPGFWKRVFR